MKRLATGLFVVLALAGCGGTGDQASDEGSATPLVVEDWQGKAVSTLCVEGEEDYGSGPNAATPVQEGIASFFSDIVIDDGCDATITVALVGEARSATYSLDSPGSQGIEFYTGAEVDGTMSLTAEGELPLSVSVGGYVSPPSSLTEGGHNPRAPLGAPFWGAAYYDVCAVLQQWFGADDPHLSPCPEPFVVTFTTMAGHTPWSETARSGFLDTCKGGQVACQCLLDGTESVLTEAEWLSVRDIEYIWQWPDDLEARVRPVWGECP